MECLIISGMAGAGKSTAVDVLEDMGYYCIDNMPVSLIPRFVELFESSTEKYKKVAIVVDVRSGAGYDQLSAALETVADKAFSYRILFLDASNTVLLNRHKESRRRHPLETDERGLPEAVIEERQMLDQIRAKADFLIDTSALSSHDFKEYLVSLFSTGNEEKRGMVITVASFGFKYGMPADSDIVFDVRFLKNPYYVPELKEKTGLDEDVFRYVFSDPSAGEFVERAGSLLEFLIPRYIQEGKMSLVISVGCTGGRHRSVSIARQLAQYLGKHAHNVNLRHRDLTK
ncbi:RNase adapter RapZ [Acidaminobacterium chupaoyuni]